MHPREGWKDGRRVSRRDFLATMGAGAALGGLLGACKSTPSGSGPTSNATSIPLPRPDHPVKWPTYGDNAAIKSNLQPEKNATLQLYNWVAYINEKVVK